MSCFKTFFGVEDNVPLDTAIYCATPNKIYGVRGQYVYQFNATSGALETTFRFASKIIWGESSIVEIGSFLYIAVWRGPLAQIAPLYPPERDVYILDYNLTASVPMLLNAQADSITFGIIYPFGPATWQAGFANLFTNGTLLAGLIYPSMLSFFRVDPSNLSTMVISALDGSRSSLSDLSYDSANNSFYTNDPKAPQFQIYDFTTPTKKARASPTPQETYGHCLFPNAGTPKVYAVTGGQDIVKFNVNEAYPLVAGPAGSFTWTVIAGILPAGSTPMRIRLNPADGMMYIPNWMADSVSIIDPSTDVALRVVSGFEAPIDIVFTGTKVFAVQNSAKGLKEVV